MKQRTLTTLLVIAFLAVGKAAVSADFTMPIASVDLVCDEADGIVAVEAEHFYKQTHTDKRAWHITTSQAISDVKPDADPEHVAGASGGAYLEILPDTRATHDVKLVEGENFTDKPGVMAILHYKVDIKTPGRYYVWVRSFSTGSEDNGVHVGLNGVWPESGQRWQTVQKQAWAWDCKQRTEEVHVGVPMQLFLDIEKAGENEIMFSLREDGFEMDKFVLVSDKGYRPEGQGPTVKVKSGTLAAIEKEATPASQEGLDLLDPSLSHWEAFIGTPHVTVTGLPEGTEMSADGMKGKPLGLDNDPKKVFSTSTEGGTTVLKVSGEIYGGLTTKKEFSNYHYETEFKWGERKWEPRLDKKRDSGILYHCHGEHGKFWNVWQASHEYQVQEGDLGDYFGLCGTEVKARVDRSTGNSIHDPSQPWQDKPGYIGARPEPDVPQGGWNKLELYVLGDSAIHVVNGHVVLSIAEALTKQGEPLTSGEVQLQSEAAECYYRYMKITPIQSFPKNLAEKAGLSVNGGIARTNTQ